jgi:hypothetical protein
MCAGFANAIADIILSNYHPSTIRLPSGTNVTQRYAYPVKHASHADSSSLTGMAKTKTAHSQTQTVTPHAAPAQEHVDRYHY